MKNILILSSGRRVELVQAFKSEQLKRGLNLRILATDLRPELSAACQSVDLAIKSPRVTDSGYIDFLLQICKSQNIGLVIPTIDTELLILSKCRKEFLEHGINIVISDETLVQKCRDKRLTALLFKELGIASPEIYEKSKIKFPCFAKPYDGSCSVGAMPIYSSDMMSNALLEDEKMIFMQLIGNSHHEYTVDAFYDSKGVLRCFVPRQRIEVRGGEISKGVTRRNYVYNYLKDKLVHLKGARGCITLQIFARPGADFFALEINPRFGGGFPLSYSAGANYPGWLIDEYLLGFKIPFKDDWEDNLLMLRYDAKVLVHDTDI